MIRLSLRRSCLGMALLLVFATPQAAATQSLPPPSSSVQETAASFVDPVRLERAHRRLVQVVAKLGGSATLGQLLSLSLQAGDAGALADDHRATLVAVAFYVNGWPLDFLVPEAHTWPRATRRRVTLGGRGDHAQHFIVSAAMAAAAGSVIADAIAIAKEIRDSQGGSGFSFDDVVANRAGQRFGMLAAGSAASATQLAARLRTALTDGDIMPATSGLPGSMSEQAFSARYGAIGSPAYNQVIADIDRRLDGLALYR